MPLPSATALILMLLLGGCGWFSCPDDMVAIPGGAVTLGMDPPTRPWHAPADTVRLRAFCIDRYEHPNRAGALPAARVSWWEAREACQEQGKRLCTAAEWERACRGTEGRLYTYGDTREPAACNTPIEGSGPNGQGIPYAPSGSHPRCVTPEGVFDLGGNVSEWVEDEWSGPPPPRGVDGSHVSPGDELRTVRGGTMWSDTFYGQDCTSAHGHPPGARLDDDGFRCCKSRLAF